MNANQDHRDPSASDVATGLNPQRLLWAGFMAILAAGVGFSIRAGILGQWAEQYGFTQTELGAITGGGLTGFGIIILLSSLIADRIGFGPLMFAAFVMHLISAALTLATGAAYEAGGKPLAFQCLFWGMFLFAIGNGIAEAVVNPLVATLFPKNKTHYLNILHAGWPGGLILGGLASYFMAGGVGGKPVSWQFQISLFLAPVVLYGLMMLGQRFPKSEASSSGVSYRDMLGELGLVGAAVICGLLALFFKSDLGLPPLVAGGIAAALLVSFGAATGFRFGHLLLAALLLVHAMVGYVELGTDSWISKITGTIMNSPANGLLLFVYTSGLMFVLRFFAGPIVERISPLGLLAASALFGAIGAAGGVGMLAAGLLGGPGIGFLQDQMRRHLRAPHRPGRPSDGGTDGVSAEVSELTQAIELSPLRCTQSHRRDGRDRTSSCGSRSLGRAGAISGKKILQPECGWPANRERREAGSERDHRFVA